MSDWEVGEKVLLFEGYGHRRSIRTVSRLTKTTVELHAYEVCLFDRISGRGKGDLSYGRPYIYKLTPELETAVLIENTKATLYAGFKDIEVTPANLAFLRDRIADINQFKKKE